MSTLSKFHALSAIYFGLASAVMAQPASAPSEPAPPPAENTRQDRFQHPMLEPRHGNDARPGATDGQRIQRRGMGDTRQDGDIQRNVAPGAADRSGELMPPRNRQEEGSRRTDR